MTGPDGAARLTDVPWGHYEISVRSPVHEEQRHSLTLLPQRTDTLCITLRRLRLLDEVESIKR